MQMVQKENVKGKLEMLAFGKTMRVLLISYTLRPQNGWEPKRNISNII